nr:hypothetical protein [Fulvimarina pelagi]
MLNWTLAAIISVASIYPTSANAQSMSPMRQVVNSFTDTFAVRVYPANPYSKPINVSVRVYDQNFRPVAASVAGRNFTLPGNGSRQILVLVPFDGQRERKVRICTESVPFPNQQTQIKAQICGKFLGRRIVY